MMPIPSLCDRASSEELLMSSGGRHVQVLNARSFCLRAAVPLKHPSGVGRAAWCAAWCAARCAACVPARCAAWCAARCAACVPGKPLVLRDLATRDDDLQRKCMGYANDTQVPSFCASRSPHAQEQVVTTRVRARSKELPRTAGCPLLAVLGQNIRELQRINQWTGAGQGKRPKAGWLGLGWPSPFTWGKRDLHSIRLNDPLAPIRGAPDVVFVVDDHTAAEQELFQLVGIPEVPGAALLEALRHDVDDLLRLQLAGARCRWDVDVDRASPAVASEPLVVRRVVDFHSVLAKLVEDLVGALEAPCAACMDSLRDQFLDLRGQELARTRRNLLHGRRAAEKMRRLCGKPREVNPLASELTEIGRRVRRHDGWCRSPLVHSRVAALPAARIRVCCPLCWVHRPLRVHLHASPLLRALQRTETVLGAPGQQHVVLGFQSSRALPQGVSCAMIIWWITSRVQKFLRVIIGRSCR
eukprot:scaffold48_cov311-Pinguiococcus_pyrenoidosus.AAC.114